MPPQSPPLQPPPSSSHSNNDDDDADPSTGDLFADPADFYPPTPPPTTQTYVLGDRTLPLHLVGHSVLEAHRVWNGARATADLFGAEPARVRGRAVVELGAASGLPSLVAGALGARRVVLTDFPDPDLVATMARNIALWRTDVGFPAEEDEETDREAVVTTGYVWGGDPAPLLGLLPAGSRGFDVVIMADLLFRHSAHGHLVESIHGLLRRSSDAAAYVIFTSYRPWLRDKDLAFFDVARESGLVVEPLFEKKTERPLFEDDPGDEEVRKTVSAFVVRWPEHLWED